MSTVVVLNDSWKPKIIELIPFQNGEMRRTKDNNKSFSKSVHQESDRHFPILAVTRGGSGVDEQRRSDSTWSKSKEMGLNREHSFKQESPPNGSGEKLNKKIEFSKMSEKTHYFRDDQQTCALQDLNEQSSSKMVENSVPYENSVPVSKNLQFPNRQFPKPTMAIGNRYFLNHSSSKSSAKSTPGEEQLQRFHENYAREQLLKSKKYKVNVNQLPRSNTPILDHDPDKLNMKQVIQFLQHSKSAENPKLSDKNTNNHDSQYVFRYRTPDDNRYLFERVAIQEQRLTMKSRESQNSSVTSVRSTPIIKRSAHNRSPDSQASSVQTVKSVVEKPKEPKRKKSIKEFKLHRFLSVAPRKKPASIGNIVVSGINPSTDNSSREVKDSKFNGQVLTATVSQVLEPEMKYRSPLSARNSLIENGLEPLKSPSSEKSTLVRQELSRTTTIHRKVRKHVKIDRPLQQNKATKVPSCSEIWLPTMNDVDDSDGDCGDDKDEESIIFENGQAKNVVRECFVGANSSVLDSDSSESCVTNNMDHANADDRNDAVEDQDSEQATISVSIQPRISLNVLHNSSFYPRSKRHVMPVLQKEKPVTPRQLLVNVPSDNKSPPNDVIKLSLRKEKGVTADRSYMIDMANVTNLSHSYDSEYYLDENHDRYTGSIKNVSGQQKILSPEDDNFVSNSMAKSCIKVRKKLKGKLFNMPDQN